MNYDTLFELYRRMNANRDYMIAYKTVRAVTARCPKVVVTMNDEMIRKAGIADEMEIGGLPVIRDDGECEFSVSAVGETGKYIMLVYDRRWGAFRCAVNNSPDLVGAALFRVDPENVPDFVYEAATL